LNLVSCVASLKYALPSLENFDFVVREKIKHFREFAKNDNVNVVLQPGIYATYSELIMGRNPSDDRTMPSAWLDLTVTSTVKHEKLCGCRRICMRTDRSTSIGLWYGNNTMRKWCFPRTAVGQARDMGVLLDIEDNSAMNMLMNITVPKSWCITWVESKSPFTSAYIFQQQRLFDCTGLLDEIDHADRA
jgi:hypothetical protein